MNKQTIPVLQGTRLTQKTVLTLAELCRACRVHAEQIEALVNEGILNPSGISPAQWRFSGVCLRRARIAVRLQRDLRVNLAGAALAVELLEEIETLRERNEK